MAIYAAKVVLRLGIALFSGHALRVENLAAFVIHVAKVALFGAQ